VIIIDDNSTDNTAELVKDYILKNKINLKILYADKNFAYSPKKQALTLGITHAQARLIITTDADCVAPPKWLETIWDFYQKTDAKLISSPVTFATNHTFFSHFQAIDFASLVASGAISLSLNMPNMANGANLAYTKEVFDILGGYKNTPQIASGDDEFLLQKIAQKYPQEIYFLADKNAIITTKPSQNWGEFYRQRKRWASKWKYYKDWKTKLLAFFIFLVNLNILAASFLFFLNFISFYFFVGIIFLKIIPEFIFLSIILIFFNHQKSIPFIFLVQMIYPFYVIFFAFAGFGKKYHWKGRDLS
ncbi:MAG: glycosyltransferase, partial [Bacteroidetes bacterium]